MPTSPWFTPNRRTGNLIYRATAINFNPLMAMATESAIVQCYNVEEPGALPPASTHTPCAFVSYLVHVTATSNNPGGRVHVS
ncbi:hypothetical protein LG290_08920 [Halomonas sediminis]